MTFEEAHQKLLAELDEAYAEFRRIHATRDFVNNSNQEYRKTRERLFEIEGQIFRLKDVWMTMREKHDSQ